MRGAGNFGLGQSGLAHSGYSARVVRAPAALADRDGAEESTSQPQVVDPRDAEAEARLAEAKQQAENLVQEARAKAQSILDHANDEAKRACDVRMAQELFNFTRKLRAEIDTVRPMLARMVIEAVEAIIGMLPDDEIAERMVRRALRDLDASTKAVLYASRADYVFLGQIVGKLQVSGDHSVHSVQVDPDLETGTCRVDAAGISLEIGLNAQLELLETLLLHEEAQKDSNEAISHKPATDDGESARFKSNTHSPSANLPSPQKPKAAKEEQPKPVSSGVSSGGASAMRRFAPEQKPAQKISTELSMSDDQKPESHSPEMQEKTE